MDGIGKPRSYGKYEIFDDETDALSWDAAEKRAHESLRKLGVPIPREETVAVIPPRADRPRPAEAEAPSRKAHKKSGEGDLPPMRVLLPVDKKLEAIARAHILLTWIKNNVKTLCDNEPQLITWIDEILDTAPKK